MSENKNLEGVILGMGNPLLDISANVEMDFLNKYNVKLNNAILCEKQHLPMYQELYEMKNVEYIAGGAAQNTIRVAQWMLQVPKATGYIGCIGKDKFGEKLREAAHNDCVTTHYLVDEKMPTGTCACLINNRERSLIANLSAALCFNPSFLKTEALQKAIDKARLFYVEGYFLSSSFESVKYLAQHSFANASKNKIFVLNLSAVFAAQSQELVDMLPYVDYLFGNESEALAFAKKHNWTETRIEDIALKLSGQKKENTNRFRVVVITQGSDPTVVATNGKVQTFEVPKIEKSKIVDSNGAGDAFAGGFLSGIAREKDLSECVRAAHYAAFVILQVSGTVLHGKPNFQ